MDNEFEKFMSLEVPKRISTEQDPSNVAKGLIPVSTGVGLGVELKEPNQVIDVSNEVKDQLSDQLKDVEPRLGRKGENLLVTLQNVNGAAGLKKFTQRLFENASSKRINTRLVGTSIATLNSASSVFAQALASYFGESKSKCFVFANQAQQVINGWKTQYYSGTYSIRLRGGNGDSATPLTIQTRAKSITIFYGKETDGGSMGVTIQSGNGPVVPQTPIDCNGPTEINIPLTYDLNPEFFTTIVITPPVNGFGYPEYYVTDAGDYGMTFFNSAFGGSGLWNHVGDGPLGLVAREVSAGMYPSAIPSGDLGLKETFAPTHEQVKPQLLIYSGPTNDAGNVDKYKVQLLKAITMAVNNGSSCILVIEPLNGSTSKVTWDTLRAAYYSVQEAFPDSVYIYDFDEFLSWDLKFNPKFHAPSLSDPHPGDYGYGNPHTAAGYDLCQKMGIPFQRKLGRVGSPELARVYKQPNEPLQAVVGSVWLDTSNSVNGVRKTLLSRGEGFGERGLWSCDSGENKLVGLYDQDYLINGPVSFASRKEGKNFLGDPCVIFTGQSGYDLDKTKFTPGKTVTVSYLYESVTPVLFNTLLTFGVNPFLTVKLAQQAFVKAGTSNVSVVNNAGGAGVIRRAVLTFKYPTLEEQADATASGINMNTLRFTIQGGSEANPLSVFKFKIEEGASVTIATTDTVNKATTMPLGISKSPVEPLSTVVQEGGAWQDTSNNPPVTKHMLQKDVLVNIASVAPGVFGTAISLWRSKETSINIAEDFINNATITVVNGGSKVTKGNFGPGGHPGIRWDLGTDITNSEINIDAPQGAVTLEPGTVYTLSYLVKNGRGDMVIDTVGNTSIYNNIGVISPVNALSRYLQSDLVTWAAASGAWKTIQLVRNQEYRRCKITFKASSEIIENNMFRIKLLSINQVSQWAELSEFRIEKGASVTAD